MRSSTTTNPSSATGAWWATSPPATTGTPSGGSVGLGYVRADDAVTAAWIDAGRFEIDVGGERVPARASLRAMYDPTGRPRADLRPDTEAHARRTTARITAGSGRKLRPPASEDKGAYIDQLTASASSFRCRISRRRNPTTSRVALTPHGMLVRQLIDTSPKTKKGKARRCMHESGRRDRRDPQARGSRHAHRIPGEPHPRARRAGGHPPRHRASGADRASHGGRDGEAELGRTDRGVRDAARPGRGERLRRGRAGVRRIGPDPGPADGVHTGHRPRAPQLQLDRRLPPGHQVVRAGVERGGDPERAPPRLHPAPERAARPRRRRGAGRCLRRGGPRAARPTSRS